MKKLALVLGSLLVVGSVASAKEVMPAPAPAPEKVVEYVEKPVIVYRDREVTPTWKPNGSVDVKYVWYGEVENRTPRKEKERGGKWLGDKVNNGKLETTTNINFTKNQTLNVRTRNHQTLRSSDKAGKISDDYRLRHFYKFGNLASSKVNVTSRLEYTQKTDDGAKKLGASVFFDFSDYIYSNDFFKVEKLGLRPGYVHKWAKHTSAKSENQYHLGFESEFSLPLNFSLTLEYDLAYNRAQGKNRYETEKGNKKGEWYGELTATLANNTTLYKDDAFELGFNVEGGYDTYNMHQYKPKDSKDRREYQLYLQPTLQVSYKPTDFVKLYAAAGAEYRNWAVTSESYAKNWRWQPTAWAGMKVTF